jgi:hypothetical protein
VCFRRSEEVLAVCLEEEYWVYSSACGTSAGTAEKFLIGYCFGL